METQPDPSTWLNVEQLQELAHDVMAGPAADYIAGGSGEEATLAANRQAWRRYRLVHRVLRDVSTIDTAVELVGTEANTPVLVAPTAFHELAHPEGEPATARGASAAGAITVASTLATTRLEDVAAASEAPKWFQLYVYRDRKLTEELVTRAEQAGYRALVLTVDSPVWGRRERDIRNGFTLPDGLSLANFEASEKAQLPSGGEGTDGLATYVERQLDPTLTWDAVDWLRSITDLPVLVKGLVHPDDARRALEHGCDGIVVSNHGGRQLDRGVPTARALPPVVEAVDREVPVLVDGGLRRGTDVLVALAMGADAVLVGRPVLWGLACAGAPGVERVLSLLTEELENAMALAGVASLDEVSVDLLERAPL